MSLLMWGRQRLAGFAARTLPSFETTSLLYGQQLRFKNTLKTNRSIAKRFRVRGNGRLKRMKAGAQHNTGYKTRGRSNRLGQSTPFKNKENEKKMKRCMGIF